MSEKINNKLLKLGIKLPRPADPVASYLPYVISGNLLFISGQGPFNEKGLITGKVGSDLTLDEGKDAAVRSKSSDWSWILVRNESEKRLLGSGKVVEGMAFGRVGLMA